AARWPKAPQLRGDDLLAHTAALLRFNATDQAVNLLDRGRVGRNYFLKMNRTHAFATSRQWADALTNLPDEPEEPPQALSGTTVEQFRWQRCIDHGAYQRWLELRDTEFKKWKNQADTHPDATPFALFTTGHGEEIRYWESAEQARLLPSDAIAVVQELLLRSPWDDRLLWSLAEVYFAQGKVRESHSAYEMLASDRGRQFRGPRLLTPMVQRVGVEFAKLPAEESAVLQLPDEAASPADGGLLFGLVDPLSFYTAAGLFFLAVLLMAFLQWRAIQRRTGVLGRRR
ncbi:MAG: hypothetical protein MUF18_00905, partial [Fimbriiglobus sp.]|nr:hypothetical protein [Fimbriiglobus sp.]